MAKYTVRYELREYYEKEYEASSLEDAQQMYWEDDKLFGGTPYDSDMELIEIVDEDEDGIYE